MLSRFTLEQHIVSVSMVFCRFDLESHGRFQLRYLSGKQQKELAATTLRIATTRCIPICNRRVDHEK